MQAEIVDQNSVVSARAADFDEKSRAPDPIPDPRMAVHPTMIDEFRKLGLTTAHGFLDIPGEIVSGHPDRHVMRVVLANGKTCYLKREHRIRWKDRYRNWQAGFGWSSKSVREGRLLQKLEASRLPGPQWLAFGEDGTGRAFLLVAEIDGAVDLRQALEWHDRPTELAALLGRFVAQLHEAGFDHPDLYAKHFLIDRSTNAISLLDWQRAQQRECLRWPARVRALAALVATLPDHATANGRFSDPFLQAYLRVVQNSTALKVPDFADVARRIAKMAARLERRRGIREQRQLPLADGSQRLVWLDGEALCAIPEVADGLRALEVQAGLYDRSRDRTAMQIADRPAQLEVGRHPLSIRQCWMKGRGKAWRSPELRRARLLFHLERHHVAAPKLLAFGQRRRGWGYESFVLYEAFPAAAIPFERALAIADSEGRFTLLDRLAALLANLHEAGCEALGLDRFAVCGNGAKLAVVVADPGGVAFRKYLGERRRKADLRHCCRSMMSYCEPYELQRFLLAVAGNSAKGFSTSKSG